MASAGKVILFLSVLGGGVALLALTGKKANAKTPAPPLVDVPHGDPLTGVVVVPEEGEPHEAPPIVVAPQPTKPQPFPLTPVAPPFVPPMPPFVPAPLPPLVNFPDSSPSIPPRPASPPLPPPMPAAEPQQIGQAPILALPQPDQLNDILTQAGIPLAVPPVLVQPAPTVVQTPSGPAPVVTVEEHAEAPTALHDDTAAVLAVMLPIEATAKWKRKEAVLEPWQRARNLKPDLMLGPKSVLMMAGETGLIPIVRYWPAGAQKASAVADFRAALLTLAEGKSPQHAAQLRAAAQREQGQGFGTGQKAITPTIQLST